VYRTRRRGKVGGRPELEQPLRDGISHSGSFRSARHASRADLGGYLSEAFIGRKEEKPVLEHRPAESSAVLVAVQRILGAAVLVGEEVRSVEHRIAEVFESGAMKNIGAALGDDVHLATGAAPEFRGGYAGLNGKLLDGVGDAKIAERGVNLCVDV